MKIAIPTAQGALCMHFGHCEVFALLTVDEDSRKITDETNLTPPPHEPGVLPRWLHEQGVNVIISGGMGMRAQQIFESVGISVVVGAGSGAPRDVAQQWLDGSLEVGQNVCDH